jgi:hypothetical protein
LFTAATTVAGAPAPQVAGTVQTVTIAGLTPGTTYYFAIKTTDEAGNTSTISNNPSAAAKANTVRFDGDRNKSVNENAALSFTVSATDADGDTLTFAASNLPSGASYNTTTHVFTWTPSYTQSGTVLAMLCVFGLAMAMAEPRRNRLRLRSLMLIVHTVLAAIGAKTVAENAALTFTLSATDADGDAMTYSATACLRVYS